MRIPITYLILAIVAVVVLGVADGQFKKVGNEAQRLSEIQQKRDLAIFRENVKKIQDPEAAAKRGKQFLDGQDTSKAIALFEQAAGLNQKYRDASFYLGYSYLKDIELKGKELSIEEQYNELKKAKIALLQAQKIDPLYPLTNKLLAIISQNENKN